MVKHKKKPKIFSFFMTFSYSYFSFFLDKRVKAYQCMKKEENKEHKLKTVFFKPLFDYCGGRRKTFFLLQNKNCYSSYSLNEET